MNRVAVPVLLVIHRRAAQTRRVFDAIAAARPARLFVAADGPASRQDGPLCEAAREVVNRIDWDCDVRRDYREVNMGLDRRMAAALRWTFEEVDSAIVLEDDCVPSADFFGFCASMLDRYRDDARIVHVSGECYRRDRAGDPSYYFSKYPLAWGWATWRRAWARFDPALSSWPRFKVQPDASALFDSADEERYWRTTFDQQHALAAAGGTAAWDYAWYYACMTGGLSIHPAVNLVSNVGFGALASHTGEVTALTGRPTAPLDDPVRHPGVVVRDRQTDMDTFDQRFPGGILKEQRTARHQLGRPFRWARRLLGGPAGRVR